MTDIFGDDPQTDPNPTLPELPRKTLKSGEVPKNFDIRPLPERLRPRSLDEYMGQEELIGPDAPLRRLLEADQMPSMMLWGPPGSGKTTLARLIASETKADFVTLSAVTASIKDVRYVIDIAKTNLKFQRRTILFIDEIHRFNKAQQDAFLPHVESGIVTLIGATTENPSFSVISPLLSRSRVFVLKPMSEENMISVLRRGLAEWNKSIADSESPMEADEESLKAITSLSDGDARRALGLLEVVASYRQVEKATAITEDSVRKIAQRHYIYDRNGEEHYNLISALHKTIRSSDPQGAVYWLARMLAAGEDPLYLARRLVRMASEDIGLADPQALPQAMEAMRAYQLLGSPEGELALAQAAVYLAVTPKSNAVYRAWNSAMESAKNAGSHPVPLHLRNAPTRLMKELDYGKDYDYDHDSSEGFIPKQGLPDELDDTIFFQPTDRGWEGNHRKPIMEREERRKNRKK